MQGFVFLVWMEGRKKGKVLFNDTLNRFYLRLRNVRRNMSDAM